MHMFVKLHKQIVGVLDPLGDWVALLPIRLLMAYEFAKAGLGKFGASDAFYGDVPKWFAGTSDSFPFPISLFSVEFNWFMVTWVEILGGFSLLFGLFTRFWAFSLLVVTFVAIFGVHCPDSWDSLSELWKGYAITNKGFGNYRVPLLFAAMLFPLIFLGAGKASVDNILAKKFS
jgi:putative oxidoreductase